MVKSTLYELDICHFKDTWLSKILNAWNDIRMNLEQCEMKEVPVNTKYLPWGQ